MKVFVLLLLCIDAVTSRYVSEEPLNDRPIIAVLGQHTPDDVHKSYIAASYVKYLESSGARVVPIPTHRTNDEVRELFKSVNGVLFPGGSAESTSKYVQHAQMFYDMAIEANKNGDYFPIWATCLGFETLHSLTAKDDSVVTSQISEDEALTLNFTDKAATSRLFRGLSTALYKSLASEKITYNHHSYGISADTYKTVESLNTFYDVLSTNYGTDNKEFVSTVEAREYPFYGTQWHPEKNNFEFVVKPAQKEIPHSINAVRISQYMANFFVDEARRSQHKFSSKQLEQKWSIYNDKPVYTAKNGPEGLSSFEQCFISPHIG